MTLQRARRQWLALAAAATAGSTLGRDARALAAGPLPRIDWPADTGAHAGTRIEWWYVTGTLDAAASTPPAPGPGHGFQITFFRAATGLALGAAAGSAFAARDVVFAHAAVSHVAEARHVHDQRIARPGFGIAGAAAGNTDVHVRDWHLRRAAGAPSRYTSRIESATAGFRLDLAFDGTQPPLLQGAGGVSRKGPAAENFSLYYSEPHLAVRGRVAFGDAPWQPVTGRAWLDHEWSDALLPPGAVGWDWIGFNLEGGGALTAFRLRRADGSVLWSGGSVRASATAAVRSFAADEVRFTPRTHWQSPASNARYPVAWELDTPAGRHRVEALFPAQELGALAGNGAVYWEGVSRLVDGAGRTVGHGYLEMTGYAAPLRI